MVAEWLLNDTFQWPPQISLYNSEAQISFPIPYYFLFGFRKTGNKIFVISLVIYITVYCIKLSLILFIPNRRNKKRCRNPILSGPFKVRVLLFPRQCNNINHIQYINYLIFLTNLYYLKVKNISLSFILTKYTLIDHRASFFVMK